MAGVAAVSVSCLGQVKKLHEVEQLQAAGAAGSFSSEDKEVLCFSAAPSSRLEQKGGARPVHSQFEWVLRHHLTRDSS